MKGLAASGTTVLTSFGGLFTHPALAQEARKTRKNCLLLWLCGAPSQFETWDPKPNSAFRPISTNVAGIQVSELLPSLAKRMVREWGMSDRIGPMAWETRGQVFLGEDLMTSGREYSDDTARLIDEEVSSVLHRQETRARDMIRMHRKGLDLVAQALLDKETIDGAEVARLVQAGLAEPSSNGSSVESAAPERTDGR